MNAYRRMLALSFILLVFTSMLYAAPCPTAERTMLVPAVVGEQGGGLLHMTVRVHPGNGAVLTTVSPVVGPSTQESQVQAVREAFRGLDISPSQCEVEYYFRDPAGAPSLDGPSAGMAMTVVLRAALTDRTIRDDVSITGAILPGGRAGLVGGIIDKAQASSRYGLTAIITPKQEIYENIILTRLGEERNFSAVEVRNLDDAMAVATSGAGTPIRPRFALENRPVPDSLPYRVQNGEDRQFSRVAQSINEQMQKRTSGSGVTSLSRYSAYFAKEAEQNDMLIRLGYGYTAANNAFLSQVDAAFLNLPDHDPDVEAEMRTAEACIQNAPRPALNSQNIEWVAGGNARLEWAAQKLRDVNSSLDEQRSSEERYLAIREVYYAEGWCQAGSELNKIAQEISGGAVDEGALSALARKRVAEEERALDASPLASTDAQWHLRVANRSLSDSDWAAALFDAAYVDGTRSADTDALSENSTSPIARKAERLADSQMNTVWGRTYQSQGAYMIAAGNDTDNSAADAYRVLRIAQAMEEGTGDLGNLSSSGSTTSGAGTKTNVQSPAAAGKFSYKDGVEATVGLGVVASVLGLGISIAGRMKKRKKQGG